jgi:TolB-like protein/Tfp pilus assembly protein PilF
MAEHRRSGKLAVILHADVAGSTELVQQDEYLAHERIQETFRRFGDIITKYHGHVRELRGDALLAEFDRASGAVSAALAFQEDHSEYTATLNGPIRPTVRVGIAMGEVVIADGTITGAGVVLAQRLEQLSEPGGIIIQGAVYETIPRRLPFSYDNLGTQDLKGFEEPIRAYSVSLDAGNSIPPAEKSVSPIEKPTLELPDKPSIAVLPFTNMSGDPEQEYFSDGITEDIITELSRFQSLFVIARTSSFTYKGQAVDVKRVGRELGVHYVVEGSVRKAGQRVRITAQLVDTANGNHIWAEHYDRELEDIFAVQDEVAQTIVSVLPGRLDDAAFERTKRKPTENLTAYDYVLRGIKIFKHMTRENCARAGQMFTKAIELDPEYARAHTLLANTHIWSVFMEWSTKEALGKAMKCCEVALAFDDKDSRAHTAIGFVLFLRRQDEESENHFQRAMILNPNDPDIAAFRADVLVYLGRWEEALEWINKAGRLNPFHPEYYDWYRALVLYSAHQYEQAAKAIKEMMNLDRWHHAYLAACLGQLGRFEEARKEATMFINIREKELKERGEPVPAGALDLALERADRYRNQADRDHFLDGLRKAGFPE